MYREISPADDVRYYRVPNVSVEEILKIVQNTTSLQWLDVEETRIFVRFLLT